MSIWRDGTWVNWRYLDAPTVDYHVLLAEDDAEPVGYVVYHISMHAGRSAGTIAELFARDDQARRVLTTAVIDLSIRKGADVIRTLAVPGTDEHRAFGQAGFIARAAFGVDIIPFESDLALEALRNPRNWMMAGGDFDVV